MEDGFRDFGKRMEESWKFFTIMRSQIRVFGFQLQLRIGSTVLIGFSYGQGVAVEDFEVHMRYTN